MMLKNNVDDDIQKIIIMQKEVENKRVQVILVRLQYL